jgi:hypothetical protein
MQPIDSVEILKKLARNKLIDSALIVSGVTAFSYLLAYAYEITFMSYYGAGKESARVEPIPIITTASVILLVITLLVFLLYVLTKDLSKKGWKPKARVTLLFVIVLISVVSPLMYRNDPAHFKRYLIEQVLSLLKLYALIALPVLFIVTVQKFLKRKQKPTLKAMLAGPRVAGSITAQLLLLMIIPMIGFSYSQFLAVQRAYTKEDYKIIEYDHQQLLVLREYNTHLVAAGYDAKRNTLRSDYYYMDFGETPFLKYKLLNKRLNYESKYLADLRSKQRETTKIWKYRINF